MTLAAETPAALPGVKVVTAEEVKKMLDSGVPVIDTRVAAEYAEKTIKGAISVPLTRRRAPGAWLRCAQDQFDLAKLPANKAAPLVFFCNSGECWKSYEASVVAQKAGYQDQLVPRRLPLGGAAGLPTQ